MPGAEQLLAGPLAGLVEGRAVAEIGAGAERLALRRKDDGTALHIGVERIERAGDLVDQRDVEEVVRRAADLDQADEAMLLHRDVLERRHLSVLSC